MVLKYSPMLYCPTMNLRKITTCMFRSCFQDYPISVLFPLHGSEISVALYGLSKVIDAVSNMVVA